MKLAVDLDHVLLDTEGFYSEIEKIPVKADDFKDSFETVYLDNDGTYCIADHAQQLVEQGYDVSPEDLEDLYDKAPQYLREDGLRKLTDQCEVVIATRATHYGWQQQKITASGADQYVDEEDITVVHDDPKTVPGAVMLVDDRTYEHGRVDIPGFLFDEEEDTFDEVLQAARAVVNGGSGSDG